MQALAIREQLEDAAAIAPRTGLDLRLAVLEDLAGGAIHVVADVDPPRRCEVLQLVGDAHRVAHHRELTDERSADVARDAETGVNAAVHVERHLEPLRVRTDAATHLDRSVD